jgi:hypothetical protein
MTMLVSFSIIVTNHSRKSTSREKRFILAPGFRGFGLWSMVKWLYCFEACGSVAFMVEGYG